MGENRDSADRDAFPAEEVLRHGQETVEELLRGEAVWAEPPPELEQRILREITQPPGAPSP